jgi:CubicO group peptidase (beta-lactamase class C family)/pimeloyl-ACP methyl ester carboxylesterase
MKLLRALPLVLAFLTIAATPGLACTVFCAFDGRVALAGSNEDWADPNTQVWFVPATKDNYGIVYFGFGRGEYPPGGVSRHKLVIPAEGITKIKPEDLYGLPQGGMNEKGLFVDGASTEAIKVPAAPGKKAYDGRLEDLILRKCATVEEALKLLETYAFNSVQGQWMFADKTGDSAIIEAGEVIVRKRGNYQVMTNFLQSKVEPAKVTCPRYKLVSRALAERKDLSVDLVRSLLKATAQQSTTYSAIFDLANSEVHVHHRRDFDRSVKINLKEERAKSERALTIASLFKPDDELRRRALFGAQLAPVTREVRERQKLADDGGVLLEQVFPGTSAADGDFKAGDVILAIGGVKVTGIPLFLQKIEEARAGDVLTLDVVRDGVRAKRRLALKEMPREKGDGYDVIYGSVTSHGARLRTIVTRPKGEGRHPAAMLLQGGHTCFSIDNPVGTPFGFTWVARNLARRGYVTMRIERPGCGDSEGGPLRDVDFDTELDGYKQGLRALKQLDFVDAANVFLFGHSQGGINAPLVAVEVPVRGIAVFGTVSGGGLEGMLGQRRRLAMLDGTNPADVDREVLAQARFWYPLLVEKKTPREIRELQPAPPKHVWGQWVTDDKYVAGRHFTFYHQGADKNLAEAWSEVAATRLAFGGKGASSKAPSEPAQPRVLAIWGTSDWLVDRAGNAWIAEIVNRVKPGNGTFVALDAIDHFFLRTATPEESYRYFKPVKGMPPTEFNRSIIEALCAWLDETAGRAKKAPEKPPGETRPVRRGDQFAGMDPYVRAALKKWEVPGLAIAVVKDGKVVLARGYGVCEVGKDRKVSADTAFPIASCAKSFVASAVGLLVEEGKLRWDDPVAKHLPDFELADRYLTEHVTLRDLLCHRTGLRRADLLADGTGFDAREILRRLKHLEPIAELRTQHSYNNHMYTALGEVVTRVAGRPWEQFVTERIFLPLDMKSTTARVADVSADRLALRHWRSDAGIVARPADNDMYSTVGDLAQWLKLQLAEGTCGDRRLLRPETVREMHALQSSIPVTSRPKDNIHAAQFFGSGLGWWVVDYRGHKTVSHSGAWGAWMAIMPDETLGVVVLSNLDQEYLAALLVYDVADAYLVGPETAWNPGKWESTWLRNEPVGAAYRPRDESRARLGKTRTAGTRPSLPLEKYAGTFDSKLYGRLVVRHQGGRLSITFGQFTTDLSHWQDNSFYVRAPTRLTFDWMLTFGLSGDGQVADVTVKHVGWDKDEKDHLFARGQ